MENVACTVCGCVCDDLRLTVSGDRIVRAEGACALSEPWLLAHLRRIPTVVLDPPEAGSSFLPTVRFVTAVYGIHLPGTAYRMDEVPVPLRAVLPTHYPSDHEVLGRIAERIGAAGG